MAVRKVFLRCDGPRTHSLGTHVGRIQMENLGILEAHKERWKDDGGRIRCVI